MRQVDYEDERGRKYRVKLPHGVPEAEAEKGVPVGPPDVVDELGLPEPFATRLHNMLFKHQLWTINEVRKKPKILFNALQVAMKTDINILMAAYMDLERN